MPSATPTYEEIVALEISYWEAMKAKDGARTAGLSGDPALVTGPQGVGRIPRDKMGEMTEYGDWTLNDYAFEQIETSVPAPGVAVAAYVVKQGVEIGGEAKSFRAADISVWVQEGDHWTCHAHSETILGEPPKD